VIVHREHRIGARVEEAQRLRRRAARPVEGKREQRMQPPRGRKPVAVIGGGDDLDAEPRGRGAKRIVSIRRGGQQE
jgi:hypothetical protein